MAKGPSANVLAARGRRGAVAKRQAVGWEWFDKKLISKVNLTMKGRMMLATQFLQDKVVKNINRPVTKSTGPRGGRVVTNRSKPGEFPKADTTLLKKTIFSKVIPAGKGIYDGYVGTPLDYGVILELRMKRQFLTRTLREELPTIRRILTGPIK